MPPQWVDEAIANIKKENNFSTEEQFEEALSREGMTLGELRTNIERGIVRRSMMEREIRSRVEVSESELKAEYEKQKAQFSKPPSVSLQEILVKDDAGRSRARQGDRSPRPVRARTSGRSPGPTPPPLRRRTAESWARSRRRT